MRLLERNVLTGEDLDLYVSHQANRRIIEATAERLGLPPEQVRHQPRSVWQHHGRDDSAGARRRTCEWPPEEERSRLLASVGAGFTVGSVLLRWSL